MKKAQNLSLPANAIVPLQMPKEKYVKIGMLTRKTANPLTNMYETGFYESSAIYHHSRLSPSHCPVTFAHLDSGSSRPDVKRQRQAQWSDWKMHYPSDSKE